MILPNKRELFDIPDAVTFLNCAYLSPLLKTVGEAGIEAIRKRHHPWETQSQDWFDPADELRGLFAKIVHSRADNIALVPAVSYGIAVAAGNIRLTSSQKIVLLDQQYPSNVYAWHELSRETGAEIITVKKEKGQSWTDALVAQIDSATGVVAIPNCHWTDGSLIDLEAVSNKTRAVGSKLVIDGSQSVGAYPIDVSKIKPDFLVTVGYKWLLGPYGLGYLYADDQYCLSGIPIEYSWLSKKGSEDFTRLVDYREEFRPGARRFDGGEHPALVNLWMANVALRQVLDWGVENIQESISVLTASLENKATRLGFATPPSSARVGHLIGISCDGEQIPTLNKLLSDRRIYVSFRGASIRVAPYLYNNLSDIDRLAEALQASCGSK